MIERKKVKIIIKNNFRFVNRLSAEKNERITIADKNKIYNMTIKEIWRAMQNAKVVEILDDGTEISVDELNYKKNNNTQQPSIPVNNIQLIQIDDNNGVLGYDNVTLLNTV